MFNFTLDGNMVNSKYKRVLLKLSGEALAGTYGFGIDFEVALRTSKEIKELIDGGVEVCEFFNDSGILIN